MKVCVVLPCFNVKSSILDVLSKIGDNIAKIYVVDDQCPQRTGHYVKQEYKDDRVHIIFHTENLGVGGAVCSGYKQALLDGMDIIVKVDGDGQMDPRLIDNFVRPIAGGRCDYTKGSRFHSIESLESMPGIRKFGNAVLSFVNKASSGYWDIMDPTNGFTAIHRRALELVPLDKISKRYFFESDMLFRLGIIRAVVKDIPMDSKYESEESNLSIRKVIIEFPPLYFKSFLKRVFYLYFLRDFNSASMELLVGAILLLFGGIFGAINWIWSIFSGEPATTGTVMLSVLPIILGFQLLLSAISFDVSNIPREPIFVKEGEQ